MVRNVFRAAVALCLAGMVVSAAGCSKKEATVETDPTTGDTSPPPTRDNTPPTTPPSDRDNDTGNGGEIQDVYFDYDRYELRADARSTLQENARILKEDRGATVVLEGHCDERGTDEYNLSLGQRRADAVKAYLVDLGVTGTQLQTISYGEEKPASTGHDESSWSRNRRVHFKR